MNYKNIIEKVLEEYQENKNISRLSKIYSIHRSPVPATPCSVTL